ncbi:ArsR family transcriptional regulator [Methanohalophilus halophilus]|uniref:ArsR family transcriptional regulator n=1 Tax=Methanohalophilus halophilus TaxID=2177 RepID=A0A3M9L437_9EURY|nr:ArsR family transcriptional regulator [Methanohalophilus halophilus]
MNDIKNQSNQPPTHQELDEIKQEITSMRMEFNRFLENSNRNIVEQLAADLKKNFSRVLIEYISKDAESCLKEKMARDCKMRDFCEQKFNELLGETSYLISKDNVKKDTIEKYWKEIENLRKMTNMPMCDQCFSHVNNLYQKQVDVMQSLQIYDRQEKEQKIDEIPVEIVPAICEPLANKQRLAIIKAVAGSPRGFSELSKITNLRGGNLLFHLQKLLDSEMIFQQGERGDYYISKKGYVILEGLLTIYSKM